MINSNIDEIQRIRRILSEKLDPGRYEHTLGVSFTCAALAMAYGQDIDKAEMAGLLHDCAKRYPDSVLIEKCKKNGVRLTEGELNSPAVVHAKYGRYLAVKKYGITDEDILNAISYHTTGREGMSMLEKIVYVADYIEPRRYTASDLPEIRRLAFKDLDLCMYRILEGTVGYLKAKRSRRAPDTLKARDHFRKLLDNRGSDTLN